MHTPVLLQTAVEALNVQDDGLYIDATAGEGGHLQSILDMGGSVLALDLDQKQIDNLKLRFTNQPKVKLLQGNFSLIEKLAKDNGFFPVDGIIFDLGLSVAQIKDYQRGFSHSLINEPLDMRMDANLEAGASDLINSLTGEELYELFVAGSEEINSRAIAAAIVGQRRVRPIQTVGDLTSIIDRVLTQKDKRTYSRIFQALRIAVNREFDNLKKGLVGAINIIKPTGKIVVLTFHSLEDRIVKKFARNNNLLDTGKKMSKNISKKKFERSANIRILTKK